MKIIIHGILTVMLFALVACQDGATADKHVEKAEKGKKYTCPMHPQVVNDGPGTCPVCAMDLVPVSKGGNEASLQLSDEQVLLAGIRTVALDKGTFTTHKILNGRLVANPEASSAISSRYNGRIEQLYVKQIGESLAVGQPLMKVYSEQLKILQQDYLLQQRQIKEFPKEKIFREMLQASKNKLLLYGSSERDIAALDVSGHSSPYITVRATASGIVKSIDVQEGQYIDEGTKLLALENYSRLWVEADVYPEEASAVQVGMLTKLRVMGAGTPQNMRVSFVAPQLDPGTQVLKIRGIIENTGQYEPGMMATVELPSARLAGVLNIPLAAVIRDEQGAYVWSRTGKNVFAPRKVSVGAESADMIVIEQGLENVSDIVVSGAYLLTSEFILKKGNAAMPR